jgi:hypothetical protein
MGKKILKDETSLYTGKSIVLTTQHEKSKVIAPVFARTLGATVVEYNTDTDKLGTFSGEIERKGNALDCAKIKCEFGMDATGQDYGLSSEGSFGPHPYIPFLPCNNEILYFIDRKRNFHLHLSYLSEKTNYNMQLIDSIEELQIFAKKALFPSHALIMRTDNKENKNDILKGINTQEKLDSAFKHLMNCSDSGKVWIETDMRAHMNPSRMKVIEQVAKELAKRLAILCAACKSPGWGKMSIEKGLECSWCQRPTDLMKLEIYGCIQCDYKEKMPRPDNLHKANPADCSYCNP